ncbi:MAG: hypothetical protein QOG87_2587 [Actinomycetota bacterium]
MEDEALTRRQLAIGGFTVHSTAFLITNALALLGWVVTTLLGDGPDFFFPVIPLAIWTPLLAVHAYGIFHKIPEDADVPVRLPLVVLRPGIDE